MKKLLILAIACCLVSCEMEPSPEYLKIARTLKNYLEYHCNNTPSFKDKLSCKDIKKSK